MNIVCEEGAPLPCTVAVEAAGPDARGHGHRAQPPRRHLLEGVIDLVRCIDQRIGHAPSELATALHHYKDVRSIELLRIQNAARNATE